MQSRHILPLTGIRFFAASWVVLCHFHGYLIPLVPGITYVGRYLAMGFQAVPLFFILSGFILSYNHFSDYSLSWHPRFIFLRFARLWPVHAVVLILTVAGPGLLQLDTPSSLSLAEELLMVRSWFHNNLAWNFPAWSLSVEWFAYIFIFPLAFVMFKRLRSPLVAGALVGLCLSAQVFLPLGFLPGRCAAIVFLFLAGSGLYRMYDLVKNPPAETIALCGALLFLVYLALAIYLSPLVLFTAFALLIYGLAYERGFLAKVLSNKIAVQGGLMSYSLYMTHALVLHNYLFYFWGREPHTWLLRGVVLLLLVVALTGVTAVFYFFIEQPANRKLRQWLAHYPIRPGASRIALERK